MFCTVRKQTKCDNNNGKICNPRSARCVKRNGKVGRKITLDLNLVNIEKLHEMASRL